MDGELGEVVRWEQSLDGTNQWLPLAETADVLTYRALESTTHFRAIVRNGLCEEKLTDEASVQIDPTSDGGVLEGSTEVCDDSNSGTLTLSNEVGQVVEWLSSTASDIGPWTTIGQTSKTLDYQDLSVTTYYRVVVNNGVCENDTSEAATITVYPATNSGLLSGSAVVCKGANNGELVLSDVVGDIQFWESSATANGPWTTIDNETSTLTFDDLLSTTHYRAVVQSGVCQELITNQVVVSVDELTEVGEIEGIEGVCGVLNEGQLTLIEEVGDVVKWQRSDDAVTWVDVNNTTFALSFSNLTADRYYRAQVQNGVCDPETSQAFLVQQHPLPVVSFVSDAVCEGLATTFEDKSSIEEGTIEGYFWDFTTGVSSVSQDPNYQFPESGTYGVKLIATSKEGCVNSVTQTVIVHPNPVANFGQQHVCDDVTMSFTNLSSVTSGNIVTNSWDFGDKTQSLLTEPSRLYDTAGTYSVKLTVRTDEGCADEITKEVEVYPLAVVSFSFESVCDGQEAPFRNNTIIDGATATYVWDFGDDTQSTELNPNHLFSADGTYNVRLTATTEDNCVTSQLREVRIFNQPEADFEAEDRCLGPAIEFENSSVGEELSYQWNFGDDVFSNVESPGHFYTTAGTYDVQLQVVNTDGCSDEHRGQVTVHPIPEAHFVVTDVCDTVTAVFNNFTSIVSGSVSYDWDFGDGRTASQANPRYRYASDGTYEVKLLATSAFGCQDETSEVVTVFARPVADFEVPAVCDGEVSAFTNTSTLNQGEIIAYLWDFGDETNAIVENPSKQYLNNGTYNVRLEVVSDEGCERAITKEITVYEFPIADFDVENVCIGFPIEPENQSIISVGSLQYDWDFGDGQGSSSTFPNHTYEAPGVYTITLTATSINGCADVIQKDVVIYDLPNANAGLDTTVSQGFSVRLDGGGGVDYLWSPIEGLSNSSLEDPMATPLETTTYTVLVTDQFGCEQTDTVTVTVEEDFKLVANNVFTPDGNGMNDTLGDSECGDIWYRQRASLRSLRHPGLPR